MLYLYVFFDLLALIGIIRRRLEDLMSFRILTPHQQLRGSALKVGTRELLSSNPCHARPPNPSGFLIFIFEPHVKTA